MTTDPFLELNLSSLTFRVHLLQGETSVKSVVEVCSCVAKQGVCCPEETTVFMIFSRVIPNRVFYCAFLNVQIQTSR